MRVVCDNLLTEYTEYGDANHPVVLILHGWADSSEGWSQFARQLSKNGYRVIVPDLPGFGGTQAPKQTWGLTDYALFTSAFSKKLDIQPYAIIGHSNGGAIAVRGLSRGFLNADKLVLLASAGIRASDKGKKVFMNLVAKTGKIILLPFPSGIRNNMRTKLYSAVGSDMLVVGHMQETFKRIIKDDVQADARMLRLPVLLIYGEDDTSTPVAFGEQYRQLIKDTTLEVYPRAGHFVHKDASEKVQESVRKFLS